MNWVECNLFVEGTGPFFQLEKCGCSWLVLSFCRVFCLILIGIDYVYGSGVIFFGVLRIVKVTTCQTTNRNECMKIACGDCIDQKEPHVIRSRTYMWM